MLLLKNISKTYYSSKKIACKALKGVSLELGEKGLYFLLGKSGSGKSTLLNVIGGLDRADDGEVIYNGGMLSEYSAKQLDNYRNEVVGFVFQEFNLLEQFNVNDNLTLVLKMQRRAVEDHEIECALEQVGMKEYGKRMVSELSGGQRQRIAIARALLKQSKIILADEPTGNLDSGTGEDIFDLLKEISGEKLVIVVTHDRESAEKYGDGIIEIKDGVIVQSTVAETAKQPLESEKPTEGKHRIPFAYKLRMALHNFKKHWIRSVVTSLAVSFSLLVIGVAQVQLCWNTERNIAKTYTNHDSEYIRLRYYNTFTGDRDIYNYSGVLNQAAIKWLSEHGYAFTRDIYAEDAEFLGLEFYGERLSLNETAFYYSDQSINSSIESGAVFSDGSPTDIPYEQMVGKTLVTEYGEQFIAGIYKTYYEMFDEKWDGKSNLGKYLDYVKMPTSIRKKPIPEFGGKPSLNTFGTRNRLEIRAGDKTLSYGKNDVMRIEEQDVYVYDGLESYESFEIFGDRGLERIDRMLGEDEIIISSDIYNDIFDDEQFAEQLSRVEPYDPHIWESYEDYAAAYDDVKPAHIGETLNFKFVQDDLNETLLALDGKKIVGVKDRHNGGICVAHEMIAGNISENYFVYKDNNTLVLKIDGYSNLYRALKTLREDYNVGVDTVNVIDFYGEESANKRGAQSMSIIATTSAILCMILIIGMVSFDVISRKKEIGIFKALGCKSADIMLVFLIEVLLIGMISAVLSVVGLNIFVYFLNAELNKNYGIIKSGVTFLAVDWLSYLIIFGASFVLTWIVSYLPLIKISRMKPVDAIKNL